MLDASQIDPAQLDGLDAGQLRALARQLLERTGRDAQGIVWRDAKIDKLTFEMRISAHRGRHFTVIVDAVSA